MTDKPGYYLPRGDYTHQPPGVQPEIAKKLIEQERAIVARSRADAERINRHKEQANEQGTLPQADSDNGEEG